MTDYVRRSAKPPAGKLKAAQEQFHREKVGFIDRWWLSELTTWELPVPQGALAEVPVALLSLLFGDKAVISNLVPAHFAVRQDDEHDAVGRIRSTETQLSRPDRAAISGASDKYERAYRFWFQEMAVRQRFTDGVLPYGGAERLVSGLQKAFVVKEDQVRRIRSLYRHQFPS